MAHEDAKLETSQIADYRQVLRECPDTCEKETFYDRFAKAHIEYGDVWQGVENCHPGAGKTCYDVKILDIGETFTKGKLERPFLIHAAALDAAWQGYWGSTCETQGKGDFGLDNPMVPKSIRELQISVEVPGDVGYSMPAVCRSHRHGFSELSASMNMFDKELSKVVLSMTDFRLSRLDMDDAEDVGESGGVTVDPADIASEARWDYALDAMEPKEILHVMRGVENTTQNARLIQVSSRYILGREKKITDLAINSSLRRW
jgi:zearalenone synthase (highly reducing iterative type I polyketide synthase)